MATIDRIGKKVLKNPKVSKLLQDDFDPADHIDTIISIPEYNRNFIEEIRAERVPYKRKTSFYLHISAQKNGYELLLQVTKKRDLYWITELMEKTRKELELTEDGADPLSNLTDEQKEKPLSEVQLLTLAETFTPKWEEIAVRLGLRDADIFNIKSSHAVNVIMWANQTLLKFKRKNPKKANLNFLIPFLEDNDIEIEKDDIQSIIELDKPE